jgi:hypothetical protein
MEANCVPCHNLSQVLEGCLVQFTEDHIHYSFEANKLILNVGCVSNEMYCTPVLL